MVTAQATPLTYLARAAKAEGTPAAAATIVRQALEFFQDGLPGFLASPAINEAINPAANYSGAVDYVASATNALRAVRVLGIS